jgi:hypothetical protein
MWLLTEHTREKSQFSATFFNVRHVKKAVMAKDLSFDAEQVQSAARICMFKLCTRLLIYISYWLLT